MGGHIKYVENITYNCAGGPKHKGGHSMEDGAGREQGNPFSFVKSEYMRICCCLLLRI